MYFSTQDVPGLMDTRPMFLTTGETRDCHAGYSKETLLRGRGGGRRRYRGMEKTDLRLAIISHLDIPDALILLVTSRIVH